MKTINYITTIAFLSLFSASLNAQVVINEYSVSNLADFEDNYNRYEDWFELYNTSPSVLDLTGYYLSDKINNAMKWEIPAGTTIGANGFLRFWASGRDKVVGTHYHTNFKLAQTRANVEHVVLTDPLGTVIDSHELQNTQLGHSRGRTQDGGATWGVFIDPTPNGSNNSMASYNGYTLAPTFNETAGFYSGSVTVEITNNEPNSVLHYSTDGSMVTHMSPVYSGPINVTQTSVLKARAISNDPQILPGLIDYHTFFIDENHDVVVFSTSSEELPLLLAGDKSYRPHGTLEYFDLNGDRVSHGFGEYNSHGQDSWIHDQRSYDWITRDEMGYAAEINHKIFDFKDRTEFQRFMLRAEGDDNYPGYPESAHIRDVYIHKLSQKAGLHLDERTGERCVSYVNGNFWGVYSVREKVDDPDFMDYYYGQGKHEIDFLMTWGSTWVEYWSEDSAQVYQDWAQLRSLLKNTDMSNPVNFQLADEQFDYRSLVDYILINVHTVCSDWLNYNVGWWKGKNSSGDHKKWGYILWDNDATFGHYINYTNIPSQTPDVSACFAEVLNNGFSDPEDHIDILLNLKDSPEFYQYYVTRYIDLLNTGFHCDTMLNLLDDMVAEITPSMQQHIDRWGGSLTQWQGNIQTLRQFIIDRCNFLSGGLITCHNLNGPYNLTINVEPAGLGTVQLNSLQLDEFPWTGEYYGGVDTRLIASPISAEYQFDHWTLNNHTLSPNEMTREVILQLNQEDVVTAHFSPASNVDELIINEINYNSAPGFDPEDWVEFYNPSSNALDISNWYFSDDNDLNRFTFPSGTVIPGDGYLVLVRSTPAFTSLFPNVNNIIGDIDFWLCQKWGTPKIV